MQNSTLLYHRISNNLAARENCRISRNDGGLEKWGEILKTLVGFLPSGSGINDGIRLDQTMSTPEKLVFRFSFHHINDNGFYDGWEDYAITVKPSLQFGIDIQISGKDRNNIKDYLHGIFEPALTANIWINSEDEWQCGA